jgi:hypothetical protein
VTDSVFTTTLGAQIVKELRDRSGVLDLELVTHDGCELKNDDGHLLITVRFKKRDGSEYFVCNSSPDGPDFWTALPGALADMAVRIKHEAAL